MSTATSWSHAHSKSWGVVAAVVMLLVSNTSPGEIIVLKADCVSYSSVGGTEPDATAECRLVVRSPLLLDRPVYMAYGWERISILETGERLIYDDTIAVGMPVRAFVQTSEGVRLIDGVLTSDGKIAAGGYVYDFADNPVDPDQ